MSLTYGIRVAALAGVLLAAPSVLAQAEPVGEDQVREPILESRVGISAEDTFIDVDTDAPILNGADDQPLVVLDAAASPGAGAAIDGIIDCPADLRSLLEATATAADLRAASKAEVVVLSGCAPAALFETADFSSLRSLVATLPVTRAAIEAASVDVTQIVSATVSGDTATIYATGNM